MRRAASASAAALLFLASAAAGGESPDLRYRFRQGQTWTERYERTVERLTDEGREVVANESSAARITVVSVDANGRALLRRVEGDAEPFTYYMTPIGEYELADGADDPVPNSLLNRFAPVVPTTPDELGGRVINLDLPDGGTMREVETARVVSPPGELERVRLSLDRQAAPQRGVARETLVLPSGFDSAPVPKRVEAQTDVTGSAGSGEMVFDAIAGRLIGYRMTSTVGLSLSVADTPEAKTRSVIVRVAIEWLD